MNEKLAPSLSLVALLVAGVAFAVAVSAPSEPASPAADPLIANLHAQIDEIAQRVERLDRRDVPTAMGSIESSERTTIAVDVSGLASLEERLALLEEVAAHLQAGERAKDLARFFPGAATERLRERTEALATYRARFLDPSTPTGDKVAALAILRDFRELPDARDEAVAREALRLLQDMDDDRLRAHALRQLKDFDDPLLLAEIDHLAAHGRTASVRAEALETLAGKSSGDPNFRSRLESIARDDPDAIVRRQALRSLESAADDD